MNTSAPAVSPRRPAFTRTCLRLGLTLLLLTPALHAGEPIVLGTPRTPTDPATILALEDESRRAVTVLDFATLERLWSENFVVNSPGNSIVPNRAAVFALFRSRARDGRLYSVYDIAIDGVTFTGDLAIVMGTDTVLPPTAPAGTPPAARRYTNIWRLEDGTWRLIARQATFLAPGASVGPAPVPTPPAPAS